MPLSIAGCPRGALLPLRSLLSLLALLAVTLGPWYPEYAATATAWGLTALEDQQLAGLIMWIPAGLVYTGAALALFAICLHGEEREMSAAAGAAVAGPGGAPAGVAEPSPVLLDPARRA